jgi:hypothetical protein
MIVSPSDTCGDLRAKQLKGKDQIIVIDDSHTGDHVKVPKFRSCSGAIFNKERGSCEVQKGERQ